MRSLALALGLTALVGCSNSAPDPCAACGGSPGGTIGPFVNESGLSVFLGSAAPPKDLAIESLTLSQNAELLIPEIFDQTPVATKIAPGGAIAIASSMVIIAATSTAKATSRRASLVSFIAADGTEGRFLLVGTENALGNAALRDVGGQLTIVPLDTNVTVFPIRQTQRPECSAGETTKTIEWTDRMVPGTIATQTWSNGCIDVTFEGDEKPFRACLPQDAWPFLEGRALTFNLFANQGGLAHTNGSGERGIAISDGETMLELAFVKAPLSWAAPLDGTAKLVIAAAKACVTIDRACPRITAPIGITLDEDGKQEPLAVGAPLARERNGVLVTHRIVGGRVTPVRRMECEGDASGYTIERVTLRRPAP